MVSFHRGRCYHRGPRQQL